MELGLVQSVRISQLSSCPGLRCSRLSTMKLKLLFGVQISSSIGCPRNFWRVYSCNAAAAEIASTMSMDWQPALDEVLLMSSILLAYVAGVVNKPLAVFSGKKPLKQLVSAKESVAGEEKQTACEVNIESVWRSVDRKLEDAAAAEETSSSVVQTPVLCLQALAYGPRIRLIMAASKLLRNETSRRTSSMTLVEFCGMAGQLCGYWISQESTKSEKLPPGYISADMIKAEALNGFVKLEAVQYIANLLERRGKVELHTDFLLFLCKTSSRLESRACGFDEDSKLAEGVLEDVLIAVSEGAAAMYLGAVSSMSSGWATLLHPSISTTRSLERFRNEVALQQWIHYNFDSVAAIYEDRVELWALKARGVMKQSPAEENRRFFKKKANGSRSMKAELRLARMNIRLRRSRELKALSGWRYCYCLYLEFYDIVGPLLRMMVAKLGQGLSFLLVFFIGRSFGLIYQGIRQSVKWSSDG